MNLRVPSYKFTSDVLDSLLLVFPRLGSHAACVNSLASSHIFGQAGASAFVCVARAKKNKSCFALEPKAEQASDKDSQGFQRPVIMVSLL